MVSPREFWLTLGAAVCCGALVPVAAWVAKCVVDLIASGEGVGPRFWWLLGLEAAVLLACQSAADVSDYANAILRERGRHLLRLKIFERVAELDLADLEQPEHHDKIAKAAN